MRLTEAVVLVTGASRGIGAACAAALSEAGAEVVMSARDSDRLERAAAGLGVKSIPADLRRPDAVEQLAAEALGVYGRIDAVVHSAGVGWLGRTTEMPVSALDELVQVNVRAPLLLTRALLPGMISRAHGHVCFLASIAGWTGAPHEAVYSATKGALLTFADSLEIELRGTGVGVSVVSPAIVRTDFHDCRVQPHTRRVPRPVEADQIATAVVAGIEHERVHQMVPRWLAIAPVVRTALPSAYRVLRRRFA